MTIAGLFTNTDRELWREREGDYYADSIHVTESGEIGINVGGRVVVQKLRDWHAAVEDREVLLAALREIAKEPPGCDAAWIAQQAIKDVERSG